MVPLYDEALKLVLADMRASGEAHEPPTKLTKREADTLFEASFGTPCDEAFFEFCQTCNGLQWDGLFIYGLKPQSADNDIFENNSIWREGDALTDFVIYGDNGMDLLAHQPAIEQFHLLMKPSMDIMENYASFELNARL